MKARQQHHRSSAVTNFEDSARAYLAILGGACFLFCSVGFINAYGVFQGFYREDILRNYSNFDISWIGSIAIFLLYLAAPVSGILVDKIGPKVFAPRRHPWGRISNMAC